MTDAHDDSQQREQALDPAQSFLVQAPAGSGKTELLVQRFLRLLSRVDSPEEVVALTFTRKAATQMRQRISLALNAARNGENPETAHGRKTAALAQAALARDAQYQWNICDNPSRLRVQTLDSLCASITRQMPLLSAFGTQPGITDDANALYAQAARATLQELERGHHWSQAIGQLLAHLNNNLERLAQLLTQMLANRDQWLRFIASRDDPRRARENLENALRFIVESALRDVNDAFPPSEIEEVCALARYAAGHLATQDDVPSGIARLGNIESLPATRAEALDDWRALQTFLQTGEGQWRKRVTVKEGFPAKSAGESAAQKELFQDMKTRFSELMARLQDPPMLRAQLANVAQLPPVQYGAEQWQILAALFELLRLAAASLQLVFSERGQVDFIEMAARASQALGDTEHPSDLALAMDYRIKHLLVDEFQDTSLSQFSLLEKLTAGWQSGDGRSLFLVGDPMQSIYRFRQAEVGLYLQVRDQGIGNVTLAFCQLTRNFRSQPTIIDWVNRVFPWVMPPPQAENPATGAISYTPAIAQRDMGRGQVTLHGFVGNDKDTEARRVTELVNQARLENPKATVAILVRGRSHITRLLPHLKARGHCFQSVEIEALGQRPIIQDLMALTRCLLHPGDRLSWLAVLRAPWCGLGLSDLEVIAGGNTEIGIWQRVNDAQVHALLSNDAQERVSRLAEVLALSLAERGRRNLRRWVEGSWLALGGPAAVSERSALQEAESYFALLETLDEGGGLSDFGCLAEQVDKLYAPPKANADPGLQIMTIHRAKGLEFDVVIVPGLGRTPASQNQPLLFWLQLPGKRQRRAGQPALDNQDLLLAPIAAAGEKGEPIYAYLKELDKEKTRFEECRLLYVAATRARDSLHLLGHLPEAKEGPGMPASNALLARLWPGVDTEFMQNMSDETAQENNEAAPQPPPRLQRLNHDWQAPHPPQGVSPGGKPWDDSALVTIIEEVEYSWAGADVRHVGSVVHQLLMRIGRDGLNAWDKSRVTQLKPRICASLVALGIAPERVGKRANRVITAVHNCLADERGRWLLQPHYDGHCEQALTGILAGEVVNIIIDRSFVDEQGNRWIVDYKTGSHEGGEPERFLDREKQRYAPQLQRYADLLAREESRPIRLGLYFPMLQGWREWGA